MKFLWMAALTPLIVFAGKGTELLPILTERVDRGGLAQALALIPPGALFIGGLSHGTGRFDDKGPAVATQVRSNHPLEPASLSALVAKRVLPSLITKGCPVGNS